MVERIGERPRIEPAGEPQEVEGRMPDGEAAATEDGLGRTWMLAFQRGEEEAFDRIVLRYRTMLGRFIYRYIQDAERAEDLCQEVFLRVYRARGRYHPTAGFRTWLFTIAVRLCLNDLRARKRERRVIVPLPQGEGEEGEEGIIESIADAGVEDAHEAVERRELEEAVAAAIAALPSSQRSAILLLRFEDLSYREIAEILGLSPMAVKSLINRGREKLRASLKTYLRGGSDAGS